MPNFCWVGRQALERRCRQLEQAMTSLDEAMWPHQGHQRWWIAPWQCWPALNQDKSCSLLSEDMHVCPKCLCLASGSSLRLASGSSLVTSACWPTCACTIALGSCLWWARPNHATTMCYVLHAMAPGSSMISFCHHSASWCQQCPSYGASWCHQWASLCPHWASWPEHGPWRCFSLHITICAMKSHMHMILGSPDTAPPQPHPGETGEHIITSHRLDLDIVSESCSTLVDIHKLAALQAFTGILMMSRTFCIISSCSLVAKANTCKLARPVENPNPWWLSWLHLNIWWHLWTDKLKEHSRNTMMPYTSLQTHLKTLTQAQKIRSMNAESEHGRAPPPFEEGLFSCLATCCKVAVHWGIVECSTNLVFHQEAGCSHSEGSPGNRTHHNMSATLGCAKAEKTETRDTFKSQHWDVLRQRRLKPRLLSSHKQASRWSSSKILHLWKDETSTQIPSRDATQIGR